MTSPLQAARVFRKAALIFNPASGTRQKRRLEDIRAVIDILQKGGAEAVAIPTAGPRLAAKAVQDALSTSCDAIIACGGDGTLNEVLQCVLALPSAVTLGLLPFGAGNIFAKDIGLPKDPKRAAHALLRGRIQHLPVAMIECLDIRGAPTKRAWIVATGIGVDARAICQIQSKAKARFGMYAYYAESTRQLFSRSAIFPPFVVEFLDAASGIPRQEVVTQIVAARVGYFGNHLNAYRRLGDNELQVILFRTQRRLTYVRYGAGLLMKRFNLAEKNIRDVEVVRTTEMYARALHTGDAIPMGWTDVRDQVLVETDGEFVGMLPARLALTTHTVAVLHPAADLL